MKLPHLLLAIALLLVPIAPLFAADAAPPHPLRVAIYCDVGAPDKGYDGQNGGGGPTNVEHCLRKLDPSRYSIQRVKAQDIRNGILDKFDVVVFPGGSGSGQAKGLEEQGREKVRQFVQHGGGYLGICGGAYLASSYYPWSLNLINAQVVDRKHWNRGDPAPVKLELTPLGQQALNEARSEVTCIYHQGPLLAPYNRTDLPPYQELATFGSEITQRGPKGVMIGTTAIARAGFGHGHVMVISPHPERSDGLDGFIRQAVDWVGQGPSAESATPTAASATQPTASAAVH